MGGQETIKMLSIDDKTVTTDLDRAGYRKMGVYVKAAANFDEASKLLKTEKVDLVVINMDYKGVDAVNVTRHLKGTADYAELPIGRFMTQRPETVTTTDTLNFVLHKMDGGGYRHVPVLEAGRPVSMLSVRDMLKHLTRLCRE